MTRYLFNKYHKDVPPNAINIMRPGPYGNPFVIGKDGDRDVVIDRFEDYAMHNKEFTERIQRELYQQPLVCCCWPKRCHGDTLVYIANYCRRTSVMVPNNYGVIYIPPDH